MDPAPFVARRVAGDLCRGAALVAPVLDGVVVDVGGTAMSAVLTLPLAIEDARLLVGLPLTLWCHRGPILWLEARAAHQAPFGGSLLDATGGDLPMGVPLDVLDVAPTRPYDE